MSPWAEVIWCLRPASLWKVDSQWQKASRCGCGCGGGGGGGGGVGGACISVEVDEEDRRK
ncbi:hypothetical protein TorRG33x02_090890 [Trema orientale]|uniref:Uncharacterized protein n=1 Tax=Trema orientale TaxID=63057 RepID=A0A2P5FBN7_TREOI|nr:hypothetical protein TorRG33x02_090890 [Trema orientale]